MEQLKEFLKLTRDDFKAWYREDLMIQLTYLDHIQKASDALSRRIEIGAKAQ
jgi:hypothetical protein